MAKKNRELSSMSEIDMSLQQEIQEFIVDERNVDDDADDEDGFARLRPRTAEERAEEEAHREWEDADEEIVDFEEEFEDPNELKEMLQTINAQQHRRKEKGKGKPPTAFEVLMKGKSNTEWERAERRLRAPVNTGMSDRHATYERTKARALAKEARSMLSLETFFKPVDEMLPNPHQDDVDEFEDIEKVTQELNWEDYMAAVEWYLKDTKNFSARIVNRLNHLRGYFSLRSNGRNAMDASTLVAETAVRGPYYARALRKHAKSFMERRVIPSFKQGRHRKVKSLLEDEDIELAVSAYLREYKFTLTPEKLKNHLERDIFPNLDLSTKSNTIHVETVRKWMKRKGWVYGEYKKGVYVDGHERADVVAYREKFLEEMQEFEKSMIEYDDVTLMPLDNADIKNGVRRQHILVTHDESIFHANDDNKYGWAPEGEQPLRKKGRGRGLMISDFLLDTVGRLAVPKDVYAAIEDPTFPGEACEVFEYGREKGYWTGENVVKQVNQPSLELSFLRVEF